MNPQSAYEERTEKIYETDGLCYEFEATVLECIEENGEFLVELDRTAFFPEGGGQGSDVGFLGESPVSFVEIKDGRIFHHTADRLGVGDTAHGRIDWRLRRRRMQNHGAEHIVSGLIHSLFSIENAGFHMSENEFTIDTAAPLDGEMVEKVERLANEAVWENRAIRCYYPSAEEFEALEYRSKTELSGKVRIVEVEGYDRCACCAPHLDFTGQIGVIRIKNFIKYKKGTRLTLAAGEDALDNYKRLASAASSVARMYSSVPEDIYEAVLGREEFISSKLAELHSAREKLLGLRLSGIEPTDKNICIFEDGCDSGLLRKLVNDGVELTTGIFVALSDNERGGYNYFAGIKKGDLSSLAAEMRKTLGGKGGGKGTMISGFVEADRESIVSFFDKVAEK